MDITLSQIAVYPVKSFAAIYPTAAEVVETGFRHDREWMVVASDGVFLTQRQHPDMAVLSAVPTPAGLQLTVPGLEPLVVPVVEEGPEITVQVWGQMCQAVDQGNAAAEYLESSLGRPCRLVRMPPGFRRQLGLEYRVSGRTRIGFADSSPLMLISDASLADLNSRLERPVAMSRFRPNLVIAGGTAFQEDAWTRIRIGEGFFRVVKDCIRCEIPLVDQETGEKGVEPLETLESYRAGPKGTRFGRKVVQESPATLHLGDTVEVLE
jgi:hypothetical protein